MTLVHLFARRTKARCVLVVLAAFITATVLPPADSWAFSLSEEKELGRKILEKIKEQMPLVEDGEVLTYVQSVGNRVARQLGVTPYEFQFFVMNQSVPNAFAIPGGYIFIYRGLIEMMETEGELASILAHELAHIHARHIQRRSEEGKILSVAALAGMLAGIFLGGGSGAGSALAMGSLAGAQSFALKYSRDNESEADQMGFRFLVDAGYPPQDMVNIMRRISQAQWLTNSRLPSYLSTHPALSERIQHLEDMVKKEKREGGKTARVESLGDFSIMQAALVADYSDPRRAMDRFSAGVRKNEPEAVFGLGRLYLRQGNLDGALTNLQEAARRKPTSAFVLSSLGAVYHRKGKLSDAKRVLDTALLMDPAAPIVHFRLALVLRDLGQTEEALKHLQRIEQLSPMFPDIDYEMGIILGQVSRIGEAHYYLGRYYEYKQDWRLAVVHYKKARAVLRDSPQKTAELDRSLKEAEKRQKEAHQQARR